MKTPMARNSRLPSEANKFNKLSVNVRIEPSRFKHYANWDKLFEKASPVYNFYAFTRDKATKR